MLVRFKPTAGGRRLMASGADELGLEVKDVVGEYHALSESGRVGAAAASLPGAVMHCAIKDGSSVEAKVEQLKAHPGEET